MSALIFYKKQADQIAKKWAGGITTELCIYPLDSNYEARNFDFRISTATIEQEESDFTSLPNYERSLMMLEGSIKLSHNNQPEKVIGQNEIALFNGAWNSKSVGTGRDFNVMTSSCFSHLLIYQSIANQSEKIIEVDAQMTFIAFYNLGNTFKIDVTDEIFTLSKEDFILLDVSQCHQIRCIADMGFKYLQIMITEL